MAAADRERFEQSPSPDTEPVGWTIAEQTHHQNRPVSEVKAQLHRQPTGFVEFHAMLVSMAFFQQHGPLDEGFCCTKEYLDFAMRVTRAGGTIYLEPASIVTFLTHPPAPRLQWADLPYFALRWSDVWEGHSLRYFQQKWNLASSRYFQKRYKKLGWRRWEELIQPRMDAFSWLGPERAKQVSKRLTTWEKWLNRSWCDRYTRRVAQKLECDPAAIALGQNYPPVSLAVQSPAAQPRASTAPDALAVNR